MLTSGKGGALRTPKTVHQDTEARKPPGLKTGGRTLIVLCACIASATDFKVDWRCHTCNIARAEFRGKPVILERS
jgi:hypothetical protein